MQLSNKLTFSLASLVVILGLAFATAPATAQIDATFSGITAVENDESTTATAIPAGGYLIIRKAADNATAGLPALPDDAIIATWATMPDLEALFFEEGGTILLQASVTNVNTADTANTSGPFNGLKPPHASWTEFRYDHDGDDDGFAADGSAQGTADNGIKDSSEAAATPGTDAASGAVDVRVDDLSITEIMWALNNAQIGGPTAADHQWIEIHNRNQNAAIPLAGLVLKIKSGDPPLIIDTPKVDANADNVADTGDTSALRGVDRIENVSAVGKAWEPKGQNGTVGNATANVVAVPFISMFRNRGKLGKDEGSNIGHWTASSQVYLANHKGTPGKAERAGVATFTTKGFTLGDVRINEVGNRNNANKAYEWIELKGPAGKVLENWQVSVLTAVDAEVPLFTLPKKAIPANGILLVVSSEPMRGDNHPLAAGWNLEKDADEQADGVASNPDPAARRHSAGYIVREFAGNGLPNGDFVLVLRSGNDKIKKNEKIVDIAGYENGGLKIADTDPKYTNLWPLQGGVRGADFNKNNFVDESVHRRQHDGVWGTSSIRAGHGDANNDDKAAFRDVNWTGIGYKRNAMNDSDIGGTNNGHALGGTPGYPNDALKGEGADATASVQISEIMYARGDRNLTQWIELRNTSDTIGVDVGLWKLEIVNHQHMMDADGMMVDWEDNYSETVNLSGKIPPGQSYLIVGRSTSTGRDTTKLPDERIRDVNKKRNEMLLNPYGFQLTLKTKRNKAAAEQETVDQVGNLKPKPTSRRADAQSFQDDVAWNWPVAVNEDGDRISVVRVPVRSAADIPMDEMMATGMTADGWALYTDTDQYDNINEDTYYGHDTDFGSPGHHHGGILPVSLSKFRPERMKDTGQVVIRWVTESETNNAGFNILLSVTRDGQFTKLNTQLIAGQGTTSERTAYEFVDKTAKPNVVYYYQIQDVSFDGGVTTLRTTHLRGNVTAAGKLTTTWADLKSQD